tara:strand:- start:1149 stop:1697 length:549 start_codon:yes stop_codon:yes gene_type:complete
MNNYLEKQLNMISYKNMKKFLILIAITGLLPLKNINAEYEMHIPNCTQKGVENCGGFLFDNETGDVLFCGSENCIDLKLPKSWRAKQKDKQSKQDQIIEMLSNIQVGTVNMSNEKIDKSSQPAQEKKVDTKKEEKKSDTKQEKKPEKKAEKCDKEKKSLCKGSGGMQLGGTKMKLKKPKKSD